MLQMLVYGLMHAYAINEYCCLSENTTMKKIQQRSCDDCV